MRRTATRDTELAGERIGQGDKLALWYVAGNRDESASRTRSVLTCAATRTTRASAAAVDTSVSAPASRAWSSSCGSKKRCAASLT